MASSNESDRSRLLKLIDGAPAKEDASPEAPQAVKKVSWKQGLKAGLTRLGSLGRGKGSGAWSRIWRLSTLNSVLAILVLGTAGYAVFRFATAGGELRQSFLPKDFPSTEVVEPQRSRALEEYLRVSGGKDIFDPHRMGGPRAVQPAESGALSGEETGNERVPAPANPQPGGGTLSAAPEQPYAGLRLVGVSYGESPRAMIEDMGTQQTFFVHEGEIVNEFTVTAIYRDRVMLSHEDEVIELK
ncbi:MAG: hypothetical protein JW937_09255 [Candidatus Omnitrophica bacterium]|nr:hypothetical protein [Candidatus Omnitrophota bacterium]